MVIQRNVLVTISNISNIEKEKITHVLTYPH